RSPAAILIRRLLHRRAGHGAVRAEHAAVARQRLELGAAALADIEELAGVGRHRLERAVPAMRTGDFGFELHHGRLFERRKRGQSEKLVPQPQEALACGFLTLKAAPIRSSTKSISEPARYCTETGSISTTAPARSMARSSAARARSMSNLYWKPEQPPPSTDTRSMVPAGSALRISPIRRAA